MYIPLLQHACVGELKNDQLINILWITGSAVMVLDSGISD